ncbi:hypothetical protein LUZ61_019017 [Rhynchospora tenuis]|uniref:B box-type domain-containing protein n=1 Tax=Rhynchospora tenuis TaxID=198213 RepID=A0AAD6EMG1_9POAL|nr:hypothetical protein LUZ61_019017 [Rhynchospora tenuis]
MSDRARESERDSVPSTSSRVLSPSYPAQLTSGICVIFPKHLFSTSSDSVPSTNKSTFERLCIHGATRILTKLALTSLARDNTPGGRFWLVENGKLINWPRKNLNEIKENWVFICYVNEAFSPRSVSLKYILSTFLPHQGAKFGFNSTQVTQPFHLSRQERSWLVGFSSYVPNWLEALLGEKDFFSPCTVHESSKRNEKNIFCLDCCFGICPQCAYHHPRHRFLQIRRYMYHDVVRVEEFEKLINCSSVQSYTTNSHKVVFLNERPQTSNYRTPNLCRYCDRSLPEQYIYCCISCKVKELLRRGVGIARELRECDIMPIDEGQFTSDSILESPDLSSGSSGGGNAVNLHDKTVLVPVGMEVSSRRKKGVPVRAPLF